MKKNIKDQLDYYSCNIEFTGETIQDVNQEGLFGSQVLHLAAFLGRIEDIEVFLSHGANIDAKGDLGLTPLHYAVLGNQHESVIVLISRGARIDVENEFGETPPQMANLIQNTEIEELFPTQGRHHLISKDEAVRAKQRWEDFKNIQNKNFQV